MIIRQLIMDSQNSLAVERLYTVLSTLTRSLYHKESVHLASLFRGFVVRKLTTELQLTTAFFERHLKPILFRAA